MLIITLSTLRYVYSSKLARSDERCWLVIKKRTEMKYQIQKFLYHKIFIDMLSICIPYFQFFIIWCFPYRGCFASCDVSQVVFGVVFVETPRRKLWEEIEFFVLLYRNRENLRSIYFVDAVRCSRIGSSNSNYAAAVFMSVFFSLTRSMVPVYAIAAADERCMRGSTGYRILP